MGLHTLGVNCSVIIGQCGWLEAQFKKAGIECRVMPLACWGRSAHVPLQAGMVARFLATLPSDLTRLVREIRRSSPDVIYLNTSALVGPALAARLVGVPVVWHVREWLGDDALAFVNCQLISRLANMVIANSDFVASQFARLGTVRRVYNAVDVTEFDPSSFCKEQVRQELGLDPARPVVGMVSVITRPKGHWVLLDAAPEILRHYPNTVFLVIGGAPLPEGYDRTLRARLRRALGRCCDQARAFEEDVQRAGLTPHFRFLGFQEDVPRLLTAMDVLVFVPVAPEGFGRPLIEAGAMEVPVVASDLGPHREIVMDGETGLLVTPKDPRALADGILTLLRNPTYAHRLGENARRRVSTKFSLVDYVSDIEQVLEQIRL